MHVHRERLIAEEVIVQGGHFDPASGELCHHRSDLVHRQHEIAHHHALVAHFLEGEPAAERKPGSQLDPVEGDLQISARQAHAIDASRRCRARFSKSLANLRLPVIRGNCKTRRPGYDSHDR
jgi:hypothetical protein